MATESVRAEFHGRVVAVLAAMTMAAALAPAQVVLVNDERATGGYRLISRLNDRVSKLIDRNGEVVHRWTSEYELGTIATLQPDGTLMRTAKLDPNGLNVGTGGSGRIELLDWDSNVVWTYDLSNENQILHHDAKRLPNGNWLLLTWDRMSKDEAVATGVDPGSVGEKGILFERLIEVKPDYPSGGEIVWEWRLADHILQDRFPEMPNYGIPLENLRRVNVHFLTSDTDPDWFHANAVDYNPQLDQVLISIRNFSEFWVIDHSTTMEEAATSTGGRSGKGGDLLYRWGDPDVWGYPGWDWAGLGVQHNVQWIEEGLPGAGHILAFSNMDPTNPGQSQVVELATPAPDERGNYSLDEDGTFGPKRFEWTYQSNVPGEFSSPFISGAQRLPNGNTLICSGAQAQVFEVNPQGEVLWKFDEKNPDGSDSGAVWLFRANWYPDDFPGLSGTAAYRIPTKK